MRIHIIFQGWFPIPAIYIEARETVLAFTPWWLGFGTGKTEGGATVRCFGFLSVGR